ncbi:SDR family oxidoreductase [Parafrankia elaeagni]|uniref:SDR family oxidoreductase n=1 Tax=Parafrankia elaeagni TaxID=222534 RepID=UPI0003632A3A|nr:SDR family oxidoreductase [Parafrankia elaeagni]
MDLGIHGRRAMVCASSRGLGRACANALAREGAAVVVNGRTAADVAETAAALEAEHGAEIIPVVADVTTAEGRAALLVACPEPDILVLNSAGPPPMPFSRIDGEIWERELHALMVAPLLLLREVLPGMRRRGFGRIVAITSAMVKSPHALMSLSHASRTGLTSVLKGQSRHVARDNVTINQLLPERIDTGRQRELAEHAMKARGITWEEVRAEQIASIAAGRLGTPDEFGDACAFLCSAQAGYISGQSLQLDGGSYEGLW